MFIVSFATFQLFFGKIKTNLMVFCLMMEMFLNFFLLGRKVCWNFWGLKILENLFIILFLSWSVDFFIVFYNDLTRPVRHTWMVCSFNWLIGICIIISEFYPVQRWVVITLILGKFNLFHLLLEILNLLLFLAIFEQRN